MQAVFPRGDVITNHIFAVVMVQKKRGEMYVISGNNLSPYNNTHNSPLFKPTVVNAECKEIMFYYSSDNNNPHI